jgi:glycosyltransferase involved in cell wall biosynthesis
MRTTNTEAAAVSVVIPAYNSAHHISETLESVYDQSYRPREIIVVDDGSTDDTRAILEKYHDRVVYIYQKNAGEPAARNTGIRRASGDFIAFLDADDLWLPNKLRLQMDYFDKHPEVALVYTDMKQFDENGIVHESIKEWLEMSPPSGYVFPQLFAETLFGSGTVVFRKSCVEKAGFFDESFFVGSDYEMWLRMARHFQFGYVDEPLMMYRHHASMATRGLGRSLQNGVPWEGKVINKILALYPEVEKELGRSAVRRRRARPYFYLGVGSLERGKHAEARKLLGESLRQWPWSLRGLIRYGATFMTPSQLAKVKHFYHKLSRNNDSAKSKTRQSGAQAA